MQQAELTESSAAQRCAWNGPLVDAAGGSRRLELMMTVDASRIQVEYKLNYNMPDCWLLDGYSPPPKG
jgi:hypothetical protein